MTWYLTIWLLTGLGIAEFLVAASRRRGLLFFVNRPISMYIMTVVIWPWPTYWFFVGFIKFLLNKDNWK